MAVVAVLVFVAAYILIATERVPRSRLWCPVIKAEGAGGRSARQQWCVELVDGPGVEVGPLRDILPHRQPSPARAAAAAARLDGRIPAKLLTFAVEHLAASSYSRRPMTTGRCLCRLVWAVTAVQSAPWHLGRRVGWCPARPFVERSQGQV
jgi:hypothetical protein